MEKETESLIESMQNLEVSDDTVSPEVSTLPKDDSASSLNIKVLSKPRPGKNLIVMDIDKTIYDRTCENKFMARRPFLKEFLMEIYKDYDIAIWSATKMSVLEKKITTLKLDDVNYRIAFYLDKESMVSASIGGSTVKTKPLSVIWNQFPDYNSSNTIICDDNIQNFHFNPKNGILVSEYRFANYNADDELKKLQVYLKYLSKMNDFAAVNHDQWREIE